MTRRDHIHDQFQGREDVLEFWLFRYNEIRVATACLSPDEKARSEKFKFDHLRDKYATRTAVLRHLISSYLPISPSDVKFGFNKFGKPELLDNENLKFNLSHTDHHFCVVFGLRHELGCDIETIDDSIDVLQLVNQFFSDEEVEQVLNSRPAEHVNRFFNLWTRKEAFIKAVGQGLSFGLGRFSISSNDEKYPEVLHIDKPEFNPEEWNIWAGGDELNKWSIVRKGPINDVVVKGIKAWRSMKYDIE